MKDTIQKYFRESNTAFTTIMLFGVILLFGIAFSFSTDTFLTARNFTNIMRQTAETGMIVITVSMILLSRDIDISMGSILGLTSIILGMMMIQGIPALPACILVLFLGALLGAVDGYLVAGLNLPGMVATTGTMVLFRGLCLGITKGYPVSGLPDDFLKIAQVRLWGVVPLSYALLVVLVAAAHIIMEYTNIGLQIRVIGANRRTAVFSGIRTKRIKWLLFVANGIMISFAGIFLLARMGSAEANTGKSYDIDILASCLLGGLSLHGEGKGNILTVFMGLMGIAVMRNGFNQLAIPAIYQNMVLGILIAVSAAKWKKEKRQ